MYKIIGADNKEYGPITIEQIRQWVTEGRANGQTLVWSEASGNWKPLVTYPELAGLLPMTGTPPLPTAMTPPRSRSNSMAMWGMIMGIASIVFSCCCYGLPFNILGIIFSAIALSRIKSDPTLDGRGQAITGLVLSIVSIVIAVLLMIIGFAFNEEIMKKLEELQRGL